MKQVNVCNVTRKSECDIKACHTYRPVKLESLLQKSPFLVLDLDVVMNGGEVKDFAEDD